MEQTGYFVARIHPRQITQVFCPIKSKRRQSSILDQLATFMTPEEIKEYLKTHKNLNKPDNLKDNSHHGRISKIARKKIKKAIDYTVFLAQPKNLPEEYSGKYFQFKVNFITLTLPATQIHTDNYLKKNLLQPMLNHFRQAWRVTNYVWRAEKQKNGNLHIHILTDRYIPYLKIRSQWNKYLDNLGYIDLYRTEQRAWHAQGFKPRPALFHKWPYKKQLAAYLKGIREDWSDPNTTDVHSLRAIKDVRDYMVKCMADSDHREHNSTHPEVLVSELTKEGQTINTNIEGRLWGCSEDLSRIEGCRDDDYYDISGELLKLSGDKRCHFHAGDYYSVYNIDIVKLKKWGYLGICRMFEDYVRKRFPRYRTASLFSP